MIDNTLNLPLNLEKQVTITSKNDQIHATNGFCAGHRSQLG